MTIVKRKNSTALIFGILLAFTVACDKKSDSSPSPAVAAPAAPAPVYNSVNGTCYNTANNTPVSQTLCTNSVNGNYRWDGVTCRDINGSPVAQNLCQNSGVSGNYRWDGVTCRDINGSPVAQNLCQNSGVSGNYRWNGYQCVDYNGLAVASQLCQNSIANGYQIINGNCYTNQGSWVTYSYCSGVSGYVAGQCNGTYVMYQRGFFQTIECQGTLCSHLTLMEYYSGRQVVCQ